jgi:hypothetical protein
MSESTLQGEMPAQRAAPPDARGQGWEKGSQVRPSELTTGCEDGPDERREGPSAGMLSVAPGGAPEGQLIDQRLWGAVAALRERGLAKKAIARELGLDVKTVRKWWSRTWKPQERLGPRDHLGTGTASRGLSVGLELLRQPGWGFACPTPGNTD